MLVKTPRNRTTPTNMRDRASTGTTGPLSRGAPRLVHSGWRRCRCLTPARCPPTPDLTLSSSEVERALSCLEKVKRIRAPAFLSSNGAELAFLFNLHWLRVSVQMLLSFA